LQPLHHGFGQYGLVGAGIEHEAEWAATVDGHEGDDALGMRIGCARMPGKQAAAGQQRGQRKRKAPEAFRLPGPHQQLTFNCCYFRI